MKIDNLKPCTLVELEFSNQWSLSEKEPSTEHAVFVGMSGSGDERLAEFISPTNSDQMFTWSAYRYKGRWVYGSGAAPVRLVNVIREFTPKEES